MDDRTVTGRWLEVVDLVARYGPHLRLAELARSTTIPKPTVRRIAEDLVRRSVLSRSAYGYSLGPELDRLSRVAAAHVEFIEARSVLTELHAACGGISWITAGSRRPTLRTVDLVCDEELSARARAGWPDPRTDATLLTTAGGRVFLARQPDLVESLARASGTGDDKLASEHVRHLGARLRQVRDLGVAIESDESLPGWTCVAAPFADADGGLAVVGVTVLTSRAWRSRMVHATLAASAELTALSVHHARARTSTAGAPAPTGPAWPGETPRR